MCGITGKFVENNANFSGSEAVTVKKGKGIEVLKGSNHVYSLGDG